jgi:hypothetical protein
VTGIAAADGTRESGGFFSSARGFELLPGTRVVPGEVHGYYIDLRLKARATGWPPAWLTPASLWVDRFQWGLGSFERHLHGEEGPWLEWATAVAEHALERQRDDGAWPHAEPFLHSFPLERGWLSAMAQGEGASLLVRVAAVTGEERFEEAALRAVRVLEVPVAEGGVQTELAGGPFLEEYPTRPSSYVLNGTMFALWGLYDVRHGLGDERAGDLFERCLDTLARNVHRWDTGSWSRYDLYPHPVLDVASASYHLLHTSQLEAMNAIAPRPELAATAERFRRYSESALNRRRAFARKALFRLAVPRSRRVAAWLPWSPFFRRPL